MLDLEYLKNQWGSALAKSPYFKMQTRTKEEMAQHWDNLSKDYDNNMTQDERRVKKVLDILKNENHIDINSLALEIGSGTGIYTIPLSKCVKEVVSIDNSDKMTDILKAKANKDGVKNIVTLNENWNAIDLKEKGLYKRFDLVLSSLNPSVNDFDSLNKMNESSKGSCCLISWAGSIENKVSSDLNSIILGENPQKGGYDIIYPFSILYSMGYFPKLDYVDFGWTCENSYDQAVNKLCQKYWVYGDITPEIKDKISKYVEDNMIHGIFRESFKTKLGIITWKVK